MLKKVQEVKNRIKMQFPDLEGDHDVLVIGAHDVGKSSMINSLWLSMTGEKEERSPPVGKPYNYAPIPIYRRKTTYSPKSGIRINGGSLKFWDTRGFQKVNQISRLATLFRFILEGRMAPGYFHQALMLSEDTVIKNCKKIDISRSNIYKAVIFIERENPTPAMVKQTQKLAEALQKGLSRSKFHAVKNIPIIRVKNGAEQEVRSLGRSTMTSVSSCESLSEVGMPSQQHNIESYTWSVNYTDFDIDEIDSDDLEVPPVVKVQTNEDGELEEVPTDEEDEGEEFQQDKEEGGNSDSGNADFGNEGNSAGAECGNSQYMLKMNIKPSNRFEFSYRLGPAQEELTPEKHLSLLLFLNNLLTIICHPDSEESKKWRFDKNAVKYSDKKVTCTHALRNLLRSKDGRRMQN